MANPLLMGAGIVSNIIGGIAGKEAGRDAAGEANNAMNIAFQELEKIGLPPDLSKKIIFEQFKQAGILTPELEQNIASGPSKMAAITEDPALKQAQTEALQILQERGKGGLNPEDRAALNQIRKQMAVEAEAKRQQILQNFQARGQGGSGAELIAALQGSQSTANEGSEAGDRLAALASQNALQSISQAGQLGGQIRGQEFGQKSAVASAEDAMKKFDVANQVGTQERNVGAKNAAQAANLSNAQNISNANVGTANQELLRENEAKRQEWLDEMNRAQVRSGARMAQAEQLTGQSQRAAAGAAAPFQAIGAGLTTLAAPKAEKALYDGGPVEDYRDGGKVPGTAIFPGDHPANDTVHAKLSPGEIVVPRTVAKTNFGKKLAKLLEDHHELRKQLDNNTPKYDEGGEVKPDAYENYAQNSQVRALPSEEERKKTEDSLRKAFNFNAGGEVPSYNQGGPVEISADALRAIIERTRNNV